MTEKFSVNLIKTGAVILIITIVLFSWKSCNISVAQPIDSNKFDHFGSFVSGLIGTIWSLAGIVLVYVALQDQRRDFNTNQQVLTTQVQALEQQIREFELQREELQLTREVFIDQSTTLKTQQFDSTFFNSFSLLNNITSNINIILAPQQIPGGLGAQRAFPQPDRSLVFNGKDSFEYFYQDFRSEFQRRYSNYVTRNIRETFRPDEPGFSVNLEVHHEIIREAYEEFFTKYQADLGHYFRTLYNIVRFVKDQCPSNPKYYTNLIRAQLSTFEHLLLFYNCVTEYGEDRFQPLAIEFSMLDNMPRGKLLDPMHKDLYPEEAYL